MIGYREFVGLSQSSDSDERGHAAHLAALAYLDHRGPADEHAALYAALIGFLDDPSVKVRAALAYGLLHATDAPRPIILALLADSAVIARAVLQYSPILLDADLIGVVRNADAVTLLAIAQRETLSPRIASALIARDLPDLTLRLLRRADVTLPSDLLITLARKLGDDPASRGALLSRSDLPGAARLYLVHKATASLAQCRIVKGALASDRLKRLMRDGTDTALSIIGEAAAREQRRDYVEELVATDNLNTRLLLHAVVTGHVMFFAACVAELSDLAAEKVFSILEGGSRTALSALFSRCGLDAGITRLLMRLVLHARSTDLADDVAARHYVVTALTEELIAEHDGEIPQELEEAFAYLNEQNIALARRAARGVMSAFSNHGEPVMSLPPGEAPERLELPAA